MCALRIIQNISLLYNSFSDGKNYNAKKQQHNLKDITLKFEAEQ